MKHNFSQEPESEQTFRKPITRRGRTVRTYFSIQDTIDYISTERFQTLSEYKNYVTEQNMTNMLPLNPYLYYGKQYPGVDAFLGNPKGTSAKHVASLLAIPENRAKALDVRLQNRLKQYDKLKEEVTTKTSKLKEEVTTKTSKVKETQLESTSTKPSLSECFGVLLEHNVSFSTLHKVNKEMNNISPKEAKEITNVLLEFLTKKDKVIA